MKQWLRNLLFRLRTPRLRGYWEARHRRLVNRLAAVGHVGLSEEKNQRLYELKRERLRACLSRVSDHGGDAVDMGCGTGQMFPVLRSFGYTITAMDFSLTATNQARLADSHARVAVGDATAAPFREGFDLVLIYDVLFHIVDDRQWRAALDELLRLRRDDGVIVIQDHLIEPAEYVGQQRHVHYRTLEAYGRWLRESGLSLLNHDHYVLPSEAAYKDLLLVGSA